MRCLVAVIGCHLLAVGAMAQTVRVNFQNETAPVPDGYLKDFGEPFGPRTGQDQGVGLVYGWVAPGTSTPRDLTGQGFDRDVVADQRLDTLIRMDDPSAPPGPGSWELELADGSYHVTVGVGDPAGTAGNHWLAVEGVFAVRDFAADAAFLHAIVTVLVTVSDGRLTLDATGGDDTRIHYVDIAGVTPTNVNFQPDGVPVPNGYLKDFGEAHGPRTGSDQGSGLTYGWVEPGTTTPVDMTGEGRDREVLADQRFDTLMHMDRPASPVSGSWELALADGPYGVTVAAGDPSYFDSVHRVRVEGNTAIDFVPDDQNRHAVGTVVAHVGDGRLTVDGSSGTNAKLHYAEIVPAPGDNPRVASVSPTDGAGEVPVGGFVSAALALPVASLDGDTVDAATVLLYPQGQRDAPVPAIVNTTGGGDAIVLDPIGDLDPATAYTFEVTSGVRDLAGNAFVPFLGSFTTGTPVAGQLPVVEFERLEVATGTKYTSLAIGPDGKLYGLAVDGRIHRWTIAPDGTLRDRELLDSLRLFEGGDRLAIGLVHDPASTAAEPIVWVSHTTYGFSDMPDWGGRISRLSGPDLEVVEPIVTGLPRSARDHVTNGVAFGPDGALYFLQGSNSAMGAPDTAWSDRSERLLSAAVIRVDVAAIDDPPVDVQTEDGGSYDPFAPGAPVTLYASGVRNAYDLVWHSNGALYVPTNGSAAGGNTPPTPDPLPASCDPRWDGPYTEPAVAGINGVNQTQNDYLYRAVAGGYYGHPNPRRCEWVLNGGNPTSADDPAEVGQYPVGTLPDRNFRGFAHDFGRNKSPDGIIEYRGATFGGALTGALLVARYSGGDDLIVLYPDGITGDIAVAYDEVDDFENFNNPLDLTEDPATGNLYVSEYGASRISLLRAVDPVATATRLDPAELIFSTVVDATSEPAAVTLTNEGSNSLTIDGLTVHGADADAFALVAPPSLPVVLASGGSIPISVAFTPGSVGSLAASLRVVTDRGTIPVGLYGLSAQGLEGGNEPPLYEVVTTLGHAIDVGGTELILGTDPGPIGDEVPVALFTRATPGPVGLVPVARYSPAFLLPFGAYLPNGIAPVHLEVGQLDGSDEPPQHQTLFPNIVTGGTAFDPGGAVFGLYTSSPTHEAYTEDALNAALFPANVEHAARVYPLRDRHGVPILHGYLVGFEEASNGDYQDYVFVLSNVLPASPTTRPELSLFRDATGSRLDWTPAVGATAYDVVEGDLGLLRSSGGDFAVATTACLGDDLPRLHQLLTSDPPLGFGSWYLVRCGDCPAPGYDSGGAGQQAPRDPGIGACP